MSASRQMACRTAGTDRKTLMIITLPAYSHDVDLRGVPLQVVPGGRSWLDWQSVGTPLTHQHYRRRYRGAYGATTTRSSSRKLSGMQPQAVQAMKGLYCCGDCTFPYVGTPAVAASGMWVANSLAPFWRHWQALDLVDP